MPGTVRRRPPWAWRLVVGTVVWFLRRLCGWRVGAQLPDEQPGPRQPLVVVFNHTSNIDAFLVVDVVRRRLRHWCQPLVKAELFDIPVLGPLARAAGAIPVVRSDEAGRVQAYDAAVARLRAGGTVMVAPEGTITHDGSLLPLRHGAARLALQAGADLLVVTHFGAQRAFSPVARFPDRDAIVTMKMDLVSPWPDEDASSLTGRIAAIMLDRSAELRAGYPQADPEAPWWPPYRQPASPSTTARENLERYRASMAEAVATARERMARYAEEHGVDERVARARERVARYAADHDLDERIARAREWASEATDELAARSWARAEALAEQARHQFEELAIHAQQMRDQARQHAAEHEADRGVEQDGARPVTPRRTPPSDASSPRR